MHFFAIQKVIQRHLNTCLGVDGYLDCVHDRVIRVTDRTSLNGQKIFIGCIFLIDESFKGTLHLLATYGCTFVVDHNSLNIGFSLTYAYYYFMRGAVGVCGEYGNTLIYPRLGVVARTGVSLKREWYEITEAMEQTKKYEQEHHQSKLQFSYKGKDFSLSRKSFAAGVELEIPTPYNNARMNLVNKRRWHRDKDGSQIEGNLEMVSLPASLSFYKSDAFVSQVRSLYAAVDAPTKAELYVDEDFCPKGSGIHIHIGWHKLNSLDAYEVREFYYKELEKRGGREWTKEQGGKSWGQFNEYSPYKPYDLLSTAKYNCVNVVNGHHIELRWMANDPDPVVVCNRIKLAIDIFEAAVLELYRHKLTTSTRLKLWTLNPHLLLRPKQQTPSLVPQTTLA